MAKRYFGYSFQVKRTKVGAITLLIFASIVITCFYLWYNKQTVTVKIQDLTFKEVFGLNEFSYNECTKAYRVNYQKETCGTICIKKEKKNTSYLEELKISMEENGFKFNKITNKKLGNKNWEYLQVNNNKPIISYYKYDSKNNTYVIEYIDQSYSLINKNQKQCVKIRNEFNKSINI